MCVDSMTFKGLDLRSLRTIALNLATTKKQEGSPSAESVLSQD